MDLEELRTVRDKERRTDSLQHLRDEFYDEATEYVRQLKRERSKHAEAAGDPYTPQAMRLTDEIDAAEETIESLYERRRGKLVKLASFAAAGQNVETGGLTDQERDLFDDLVERIEANERQVFGKMEVATTGGRSATAPEAGTSTADATAGSASEPTSGRAGAGESSSTDERASAGASVDTDRGEPVVGRDEPESSAATAADSEEPNAPAAVAGTAGEAASDAAPDTPRDPTTDTREPSADTDGASGVLAEAMGGDAADSSSDGRPAAGSDVATTSDAPTTSDSGATASTGVESPTDGATNATDATATEPTPSTTTDTTTTDGVASGSQPGGTDPSPTAPTTDGSSSTPATDPTSDDDRPAAEAAAVIGGDESPTAAGRVTEESGGAESTSAESVGAESSRGGDADSPTSADAASETPSVEREAVRVTRDVGEVYGVDERSYELAAGDTVLLPAANVDPLVERDAAERL